MNFRVFFSLRRATIAPSRPPPLLKGLTQRPDTGLKRANQSKVWDAKPPVYGRKPKTAGLPVRNDAMRARDAPQLAANLKARR